MHTCVFMHFPNSNTHAHTHTHEHAHTKHARVHAHAQDHFYYGQWPQGVDCSLKAAQKTLKENETESLRGREEERVCVRVCVCGRDREMPEPV